MASNSRPSTPNFSQDMQSLSVQDTPYSQGSGSHSSYRSQNHQSDYKPYLREDLQNMYSITLEQFLVHILKIAPSDVNQGRSTLKPADYQLFQKQMKVYHDTTGHETNLYNPFVRLANQIVDIVTNTLEVVFCRDDPVFVKGSAGRR